MSFVTGNGINHRAFNLLPGFSAATPGGDPYWSNVTALLNFVWQGSASVTLDSSTYNRMVTGPFGSFVSNAEFVTGWPAGYSAAFQPFEFNYGRLSMPGNFTVEAWIRNNFPADAPVFAIVSGFGADIPVNVAVDSLGKITVECEGDSLATYGVTSTLSIPTTWFHLAIVKNAGVVDFYVDGVVYGSFAMAEAVHSSSRFSGYAADSVIDGWDMQIGAVRITENVARYSAPFTPPTAPFPVGA